VWQAFRAQWREHGSGGGQGSVRGLLSIFSRSR